MPGPRNPKETDENWGLEILSTTRPSLTQTGAGWFLRFNLAVVRWRELLDPAKRTTHAVNQLSRPAHPEGTDRRLSPISPPNPLPALALSESSRWLCHAVRTNALTTSPGQEGVAQLGQPTCPWRRHQQPDELPVASLWCARASRCKLRCSVAYRSVKAPGRN